VVQDTEAGEEEEEGLNAIDRLNEDYRLPGKKISMHH
jgi:hypothetical protein